MQCFSLADWQSLGKIGSEILPFNSVEIFFSLTNFFTQNQLPDFPESVWLLSEWVTKRQKHNVTWPTETFERLLDKVPFVESLITINEGPSPGRYSLRADQAIVCLQYGGKCLLTKIWSIHFRKSLIQLFNLGFMLTLSMEAGAWLKCWILHCNTSLMILFRQIWLLAFSQPFLFLATPLDLHYAQNLTALGLKLRLWTCHRYCFRT